METPTNTGRTPPYMSFETFKNFIVRLNGDDLPSRIDRSLMVGMAGGAQTATIAALREFGMIEGEGNGTTPVLERFAQASEDALPDLFAELVRGYYEKELKLSAENGTADQLDELFTEQYDFRGSTRRKAVTFFLHAAKYSKITLSSHFKVPRSVPSGKRPASRPKNAAGRQTPPAAPTPPGTGASAHSKTINLPGATVTLSYTADLFELGTEDRDFILHLVDQLKSYEAGCATAPPEVAPEEPEVDD